MEQNDNENLFSDKQNLAEKKNEQESSISTEQNEQINLATTEQTLATVNQNTSIRTNNNEHFDMPTKLAISNNLNRLGIILSNYAILGLVLMFSTFLFYIFYIVYYLIIASIVLLTLGMILLVNKDYLSLFSTDVFNGINSAISSSMPYILVITLICAVASLILLCINKHNKSVSRIVFASILIGIVAIFAIALLVRGN